MSAISIALRRISSPCLAANALAKSVALFFEPRFRPGFPFANGRPRGGFSSSIGRAPAGFARPATVHANCYDCRICEGEYSKQMDLTSPRYRVIYAERAPILLQ